MKVLKIENKKCFYSIDGNTFNSIVDIAKEDIYSILDVLYQNDDFEIDEYENVEIVNDAEKIIYQNLYKQLKSFIEQKETLISEITDELKIVKDKYEIK